LDVKKRFTEEQIIGFLREAEAGMPVKELCGETGGQCGLSDEPAGLRQTGARSDVRQARQVLSAPDRRIAGCLVNRDSI